MRRSADALIAAGYNRPNPPADGSYAYQTDVVVTPGDAKRFVAANAENNRNPKLGRIPGYARDMRAGRWRERTGETIKVAPDGAFIDGRNRMQAVILADVPIVFDIAWNVPRDNMPIIDTGASRTLADALKIDGASDRMVGGSVVRWVISWDAGNYMATGSRVAPTISEMQERYRQDPDGFDAAAARGRDCSRQDLGVAGPTGTAYYLFNRIDPVAARTLFDGYVSGANLSGDSPILTLRNRMARIKRDRITRQEQLALMIRGWNAWRLGETPKSLIIVKGDLSNANFPQPVTRDRRPDSVTSLG